MMEQHFESVSISLTPAAISPVEKVLVLWALWLSGISMSGLTMTTEPLNKIWLRFGQGLYVGELFDSMVCYGQVRLLVYREPILLFQKLNQNFRNFIYEHSLGHQNY